MELNNFSKVVWGTSPIGDKKDISELIHILESDNVRLIPVSRNSGVLEWGGCHHITPFHLCGGNNNK
jgi:hypothetical protein